VVNTGEYNWRLTEIIRFADSVLILISDSIIQRHNTSTLLEAELTNMDVSPEDLRRLCDRFRVLIIG